MAHSLRLEATEESLRAATEFVRLGATEAGWPADRLGEVDLLLEELFVNIARYAYPKDVQGTVHLSWSAPRPGVLAIEIADRGAPFNPLAREDPNMTAALEDRPIGGLGIYLVRRMASAIEYRRDGDWNRLRFEMS